MNIRKTHSREYASWKVLRQNNPDDIDDSWGTFEKFLPSIGVRPSSNHVLARVDSTLPWGHTNFRWRELNKIPGQKFDMKAYLKRYRTEYRPHYDRERRYKNKYGITLQQYEEMLARQDNRCAICREHESQAQQGTVRQLAIDHDHRTKKVRELVCNSCNAIMGHADDSIERLKDIITYLRKHGKQGN